MQRTVRDIREGTMTQTITDFKSFLEDAKQAVTELSEFSGKENALRQEEQRLERTLEAEKKAVNDSVNATVKKRREEIARSYDNEIGKLQEKLRKTRSRRERAKNQGIKDRIKEETMELYEHNRELKVRMRTLFQADRVPFYCGSGFYYALYFPRGIKEILTLLITFAVCFLAIPYGIYMALPQKKTLFLVLIYGAAVFIFGGIYVLIGNVTKDRHMKALKEGRTIRSLMASNRRKIRVITASIRKDRDEAIYNLEKYDDEIAQMEQELEQVTQKKKEALGTFENVTKTIITDEIVGNSRQRLEELAQAHQEVQDRLRYTEKVLKEKKIFITDTYESYLGKEFLYPDKLDELKKIMESDAAVNLSEAMEIYRSHNRK